MAYKFQLGASTMSGSLVQEGAIECDTSLTIGNAELTEAELEKLDGITNGTGAANKCLVLDASRNIDTINALGIASMANNWTNAGRTVADMGILTTVDINGGSMDGVTIGAASVAPGSFAAVVGTTGTYSGILKTDDTTEATSTTDGSLQTDGGLSVAKDAIFGNDVKLLTDSAVLSLGVGSDATFTHDGTTGLTIAATPISVNSTGDLTLDSSTDIVLDADGADIILKDGGTEFGRFTNASSDFVVHSAISDQDMLFKGNDGGSTITALTLDMSAAGNATFNGTVTAAGSFIIGSADMSEADLEQLDGITAGTGSASKCFVADASGHFAMQDSKKFRLGAGNDMQLYHDGTNSYIANSTGALKIATENSGIAVTIGHSSSEVTIADNLTVSGDLTVNGTTTTVDIEVIQTSNGVIFEGASADNNETTLKAVDPTADRTIQLANQDGYLIPFAAASTTAISSTPAELNVLDGISGLVVADLNVIAGCAGNGLVIADLTKLAGVDASATELNYSDITTLGSSEASKVLTADASGDITIVGAAANMVWDKSADALEFADNASAEFGTGLDMKIYHDGTNSYIANAVGALKLATETSGIAVTIGHSTSEVTVADNLTVTGDLTVNGGFSSSVTIASGSNGATLTKGKLTYFDNINAAASASFPQNPSVGDWFEVKNHSVGSATNSMTLNVQAGQTCDGGTSVVLESPFAAIKCVYVVTGSWRIL